MKTRDIFRMAIRNLSFNKTNNYITMFIIFLLDLLLIIFLAIGVNVKNYINKSVSSVLENDELSIVYNTPLGLILEDIEFIEQVVGSKYDVVVSTNTSGVTAIDFGISKMNYDTDVNYLEFKTNPYILLNESLKDEYKIGDIYRVYISDFIVMGYTNEYDAAVDLSYFLSNCRTLINVKIKYIENDFDSLTNVIDYFNNVRDRLSKHGGDIVSVDSYILDTVNDAYLLSNVSYFLLMIIAVLLLILSLSTIKNGIRIAIDSDMYFIRMFKLCGANNRDIFKIYLSEMIIVIFSSVFLTTGLVFIFKNLINNISYFYSKTIVSIFIDMIEISPTEFYFPFYIPLISLLLTMLFVIISSYKSFKKRISDYDELVIVGGEEHE
ncbi:MAG: ABC transporter permease [Anaeroplasmataceae bacterium]